MSSQRVTTCYCRFWDGYTLRCQKRTFCLKNPLLRNRNSLDEDSYRWRFPWIESLGRILTLLPVLSHATWTCHAKWGKGTEHVSTVCLLIMESCLWKCWHFIRPYKVHCMSWDTSVQQRNAQRYFPIVERNRTMVTPPSHAVWQKLLTGDHLMHTRHPIVRYSDEEFEELRLHSALLDRWPVPSGEKKQYWKQMIMTPQHDKFLSSYVIRYFIKACNIQTNSTGEDYEPFFSPLS